MAKYYNENAFRILIFFIKINLLLNIKGTLKSEAISGN